MKRLLQLTVFAAAAVAGTALAQPPGGGFRGGMGGPTQLLQSKTVQAELKITDDQKAKIRDMQAKIREMMQDEMKGIAREDFQEKMPAVMAKVGKATQKELAEVLKPEQMKRLKGIELQVTGLRALLAEDTAKALKVTDDQKEKLSTLAGEVQQDMRSLGEEYGVRFPGGRPADADKAAEYAKKADKITKDANEKALALMSAEQKDQYKEMVGDPVDVAKVRSEMLQGGKNRQKRQDD